MAMNTRLLRPLASGFQALRVGLDAYWPLNENATSGDVTAADWTGRGNDLTSNNSVLTVAGKIGNARGFVTANTEWLSVADNADVRLGNSDWTISAWVFVPTSATSPQFFVTKDASGNRDFVSAIRRDASGMDNRITFGIFYTGNVFAGTVGGPDRANADFINRWWQIVVTNASGVITLYENGSVVSGAGSTPTLTRAGGSEFNASASDFNIGRRAFVGNEGYATCSVDEVAKWSRALSASEISRLWNNGNGIDLRR